MCCSTLPREMTDYKVITKEEYDAAIEELFKDEETNEDGGRVNPSSLIIHL